VRERILGRARNDNSWDVIQHAHLGAELVKKRVARPGGASLRLLQVVDDKGIGAIIG